MSKEVKYICDKCGLLIDGNTTPEIGGMRIAGGGELCILTYEGLMGHNKVPMDGWHFHYYCFCEIVRKINELCKEQL